MSPKFLIDACLPRSLAVAMRSAGFEAQDVRDLGMGAAPDSEIAAWARERGLCLITRDYDFADIRVYKPSQHAGILVLEMPESLTSPEIVEFTRRVLRDEDLISSISGHLVIADQKRIRIRGD